MAQLSSETADLESGQTINGVWHVSERDRDEVELRLGEDSDEPEDLVDDTKLPIRLLHAFTFINRHNNAPKDLKEMLEVGNEWADPVGTGLVASVSAQELLEDEEGPPAQEAEQDFYWFQLSTIYTMWVNHWDSDGHIWIQTEYAWYVLKEPSAAYQPVWSRMLEPILLVTTLLEHLQTDPSMSWDKFLQDVSLRHHPVLGHLDASDFGRDDVVEELGYALDSNEKPAGFPPRLCPVLHHILGRAPHRHKADHRATPPALKHKTPLKFVVTPTIAELANDYHGLGDNMKIMAFDSASSCSAAAIGDQAPPSGKPPQPLRALDLFAGTGGFAYAFCLAAGNMEVIHAVDNNSSACRTLQAMFPHWHVHHQDANDALERAIKAHNHALPAGSRLNLDICDKPLPPVIQQDIDVVIGGFPCQGHSGLNRFKSVDDSRNPLILSQLAWVDFLKPRFCVFENVPRFLFSKLQHTEKGPVEQGYIKFLIQAMRKLGYQIRFTVLQAAHYGAPQTRQRFIMIAARQDQPLPSLPAPSHQSSKPPMSLHSLLGSKFKDSHNSAFPTRLADLLPMVTVEDAISDLPQFNWTPQHLAGGLIPTGGTAYSKQPCSPFQLKCRSGHGPSFPPSTAVSQHETAIYSQRVMELTVRVPLIPHASLHDIPVQYHDLVKPLFTVGEKDQQQKPPKGFIRLDYKQQFRTIVTNIAPNALSSSVLHPRNERVFTVRELARAQGFPDSFRFETIHDPTPPNHKKRIKEIHRQLGNAVPWPLATALGSEFKKVLEPQGTATDPIIL